MANRLKKPQKPLGFSKTVVTGYLASEPDPELRRRAKNGGLPGRPSVRRTVAPSSDAENEVAPVMSAPTHLRHPVGGQRIAALVREWLAELKVMGRSPRTIEWYRQKMVWYLDHEGGPATLDGLTSGEVKRLLGSLIDRGLAPNTVHGLLRSRARLRQRDTARSLPDRHASRMTERSAS